jgi:hypothetical protein
MYFSRRFIVIAAFVALVNLCPAHAGAQCVFSGMQTPVGDTANSYGALGNSAALLQNGHVKVIMRSLYPTPYIVDLGVWVDEHLVSKDSNIPALILSYLDHANCIFAHGVRLGSSDNVHQISFRINKNQINLYKFTTPNAPGANAPWIQQVHYDWSQVIKAQNAPAKINVLFSSRGFVDTDLLGGGQVARDANGNILWNGVGGASNGVGQGQAIVAVDANWLKNGPKPNSEDWWGLIAAHELGHAMGKGGHLSVKFDTMCCDATVPDYAASEKGYTPSSKFSLSQGVWATFLLNNASNKDNYSDPFGAFPNPVTGVLWNFPQVHGFLTPYSSWYKGNVYLAYSKSNQFAGHGWLVHDWFCINNETCAVGDIDGDKRDDLIAFEKGSAGNVYYARSTPFGYQGQGFIIANKFCVNDQVCKVADVNGDGKADLVAFSPGSARGQVYVMLNKGNGEMDGVIRRWHDFFCVDQEQCEVADVNGDHKADLVAFDHKGTVYVSLSSGNGFTGTGVKWHTSFCYGAQVCRLGDVNGDGKSDLVAFARAASASSAGKVFIAKSKGTSFGAAEKWHNFFCINDEQCEVADVTGDKKADIIAFTRGKTGDVYVATSTGGGFQGTGVKWHDWFGINNETCLLGDANGDGKKDVFSFAR